MKWPAFLAFSVVCGFSGFGMVLADEGPLPGPRTLVVALDGTGDFVSLQEAVDATKRGDTVFVKAGRYPQDVTIHSKDKIKLVGAGGSGDDSRPRYRGGGSPCGQVALWGHGH